MKISTSTPIEEIMNPSRCLVVGVLNVTPDSFSDGGQFDDPEIAFEHAMQMVEAGADIIDVGGESTRPGSEPIDAEEEMERILPVIDMLVEEHVVLSVDTTHTETANECALSGVRIINDVSGGLADSDMLPLIARLQNSDSQLAYICQHWRGSPVSMMALAVYRDVVGEVCQELDDRLACLEVYGADMRRIAIDPGLGFSKNASHNWQILRALQSMGARHRLPIMIGASRKRFLTPFALPVEVPNWHQLDQATSIVSVLAAQRGAWTVRVHNVPATVKALADPALVLSTPLGKRLSEIITDPTVLTDEEAV